jgi:hypothetical protein
MKLTARFAFGSSAPQLMRVLDEAAARQSVPTLPIRCRRAAKYVAG